MKKILVVEDTATHMEEAVALLQSKGFDVVTAVTMNEAKHLLMKEKSLMRSGEKASIDGVITDLYMPLIHGFPGYDHAEHPCGLGVAMIAKALGIPVVICTAGYHHGLKYEWINHALRESQMCRLVDVYLQGKEAESPHKEWQAALDVLKEIWGRGPSSP